MLRILMDTMLLATAPYRFGDEGRTHRSAPPAGLPQTCQRSAGITTFRPEAPHGGR